MKVGWLEKAVEDTSMMVVRGVEKVVGNGDEGAMAVDA